MTIFNPDHEGRHMIDQQRERYVSPESQDLTRWNPDPTDDYPTDAESEDSADETDRYYDETRP